MKTCTVCHNEYPATKDYFYVNKDRPSGFVAQCKKCGVKKSATWNKANKEKRKISRARSYQKNRDTLCAKRREWYYANKKRNEEITKRWTAANRERWLEKKREWAKNNTEAVRSSARKCAAKRAGNPTWRLSNSISRGIARSIANGKNRRHWEAIVGFSMAEFMSHIEKQFAPGMSWENFGEWHVDHKLPIASFVFKTSDDPDFKKCWSLDNLQPLWAIDNLRKGTKIA